MNELEYQSQWLLSEYYTTDSLQYMIEVEAKLKELGVQFTRREFK